MKYIIAYVPYSRGREQIEVILCDTPEEVVKVVVEDIGCASVELEDGIYYDEDGYEVEYGLSACLSYLDENFVGDGSFGAVMLTITEGDNLLIQV